MILSDHTQFRFSALISKVTFDGKETTDLTNPLHTMFSEAYGRHRDK